MSIKEQYRILRAKISSLSEQKQLLKTLQQLQFQQSKQETAHQIIQLLVWLSTPITPHGGVSEGQAQSLRLQYLIKVLQDNPEFKKSFSFALYTFLKNTEPMDFFCETGMIDSHAFIKELFVRISSRFLPSYRDPTQMSSFADEYLDADCDYQWLLSIDTDLIEELRKIIEWSPAEAEEIGLKYKSSMQRAQKILSVRLAYLAAQPTFRNHLSEDKRFYLLDFYTSPDSARDFNLAYDIIDEVYASLENSGVSIELVFQLERMRALLTRLDLLHLVQNAPANFETTTAFVYSILSEEDARNSISGFLSTNLGLISKKIVERAGVTGEHYIARNKSESFRLFLSAAGGGTLTVLTTIIKSIVSKLNLPLFVEGVFTWVNYSLSFILMQFMHFTLATKTPAMTASVLAAKLRKVQENEPMQEFVDETVHFMRSAFQAVLGNVLFVALGAFVADILITNSQGTHLFTDEAALKYLNAHHPFLSLTIWYAIYTGAALWLGSAVGGWFENWFVFRGLPNALAESRKLRSFIGEKGARVIANWSARNVMGIATNIALGFLLAFSTIFGKFFGIPLDVRHVTLSSGTLAFSIVGLEQPMMHVTLIVLALFSIVLIGVCNVTVSFVISMFIAAQARGVQLSQYPYLFRIIIKRFFSQPKDFFITPTAEKKVKSN